MKIPTDELGITAFTPVLEPGDIFKYGKSEYVERTLNDLTLKFDELSEYNDPFENSFQYNHYYKDEQAMNMDLLFEEGKLEEIRKKVEEELNKSVMACFSQTPFEPLMWAHYADDHKGVCYYFNRASMFEEKIRFSEIIYSTIFPSISYFDNLTSMAQLKPQIDNVILTKSTHWSYEKEIRAITEEKAQFHKFLPASLKGIIIGSRVKHKDRRDLFNYVEEFNKKHGTNIKIMTSRPSERRFKMVIETSNIRYNSPPAIHIYDNSLPVL